MDLDSELTGFTQPNQELSDHASDMNTGGPLGICVVSFPAQGYFIDFSLGIGDRTRKELPHSMPKFVPSMESEPFHLVKKYVLYFRTHMVFE